MGTGGKLLRCCIDLGKGQGHLPMLSHQFSLVNPPRLQQTVKENCPYYTEAEECEEVHMLQREERRNY